MNLPTNETNNGRTIPNMAEFLSNKGLDDIVYMYLQSISSRNPKESHRYIDKSVVNLSAVARSIGISRRTLYRKLDALEEQGHLKITPEYIKLPVPEQFFLFPAETLEYLFNNGLDAEKNLFKMIAWFAGMWKLFPHKVYFSQNQMLDEVLGENSRSASAQRKFKDNLDILFKLGIITAVKERTPKGNIVMRATSFSCIINRTEIEEVLI